MAKSSTSGQGRPRGVTNKATREIKSIAQAYGPEAIERLWALATTSDSDAAKVSAIKEILDRGYGKPHQTAEVTHFRATAAQLSDDELAGHILGSGSDGIAETQEDTPVLN